MPVSSRALIESTFAATAEGRIHFGQVVGQLIEAGVESYVVDYRSGRTTCYLEDGGTLDLPLQTEAVTIGETFDGEQVREAIRGAQDGSVMYPEFTRRAKRAGCVGYTVWITGRHVTYLGRRGETHVERFPD